MTRTGPAIELDVLKRAVSEIEQRFLAEHLKSAPSLKHLHDANSLMWQHTSCLRMGSENFVEGVALWVLTRPVIRWTTHKRVTRATASILLSQSPPSEPNGSQLVFDTLRKALDEAKVNLSRPIRENNGVSTRHLRSLLYPLGVDVPDDRYWWGP